MASSEYITKQLEGQKKKLKKLNEKMARIQKAKESNYEKNNPYYYSDYDLCTTDKDIQETLENIRIRQEALDKVLGKENSRNIKPILDFLERWQKESYDWYLEKFAEYPSAFLDYKEKKAAIKEFPWHTPEGKAAYEEKEKLYTTFQNTWAFLSPYLMHGPANPTLDKDKLREDIKKEADRKYDNMVERVVEITGTITDVSGLSIGSNLELNGVIIGEKASARIETISAGGYNIQRFHYRTLVHKV